MKILDRVDISGSMNLASTAKDTFTIGTPLENNDGNVDDLVVYANADFKNNVIIGSSSIDTFTVNGTMTASSGILINNNSSLSITGSGTIYYNGMDLLAAMGGGGGGNNGGGGGNNNQNQTNVNYYELEVISSSVYYIKDGTQNPAEVLYVDYTGSGGSVLYLPNPYDDLSANRKYTIKNITSDTPVTVYVSGSQKIDNLYESIVINPYESYTFHPLKDTNIQNNPIAWHILDISKNVPPNSVSGSSNIIYANDTIFLNNVSQFTMSNSDVGKQIIFTFNPIVSYQEPILNNGNNGALESGSINLLFGENLYSDKTLDIKLPKASENIGKTFKIRYQKTDFMKYEIHTYYGYGTQKSVSYSNMFYGGHFVTIYPQNGEYIGIVKKVYNDFSASHNKFYNKIDDPTYPYLDMPPVTTYNHYHYQNPIRPLPPQYPTIEENNVYYGFLPLYNQNPYPHELSFTAISSSDLGFSWLPNKFLNSAEIEGFSF